MIIADYVLNGQKLKYNHYIGITCIIISALSISIYGSFSEITIIEKNSAEPFIPTWIPVVIGIITPLTFTANGMLIKHMTSEKVGFITNRVSCSVFLIVNIIILIVAIPYWKNVEFTARYFWIGFVSSMFD